jgi:hypothetical protein
LFLSGSNFTWACESAVQVLIRVVAIAVPLACRSFMAVPKEVPILL